MIKVEFYGGKEFHPVQIQWNFNLILIAMFKKNKKPQNKKLNMSPYCSCYVIQVSERPGSPQFVLRLIP